MITVIVGPTGVGKTKLSISLAKHFDAEIINADAVSIYSEPNIAAAKVTVEEMCGVKHHLLGTKSLKDKNTIYEFQKEGREVLDKLISENKNVIIVGGSGLYLKALLYDYKLSAEEITKNLYEEYTNYELKTMVDNIYSDNGIHMNNRKRLLRFLNHYNSTGQFIKNDEDKNKKVYDFKIIGLTTDREKLFEIINSRVDKMLESGLINEVKELFDKKMPKIDQIIGYKELIPYFENKISLETGIEEIKRNTRKFSKRQYTWFNNQMPDIKWFDVNFENFNDTIKEVIEYLE